MLSDPKRRRLTRSRRAVRRAVLGRRRLLAALLAAVAVLATVRATRPPDPPTTPVLVAAHDLDAGSVLGPDDLEVRRYADGLAPAGTVEATRAGGRTLAAPLRAGEPVTDVRLVGDGVLAGYPGMVALPLRVPDADVVGLLRTGDRVDVLATAPRGGATARVADGVPVLAVPAVAEASVTGSAAGLTGRLVLVGVRPEDVEDVVGASVGRFLTVTLLR